MTRWCVFPVAIGFAADIVWDPIRYDFDCAEQHLGCQTNL
jgi:hypothetical protein